VLRDLKYTDMLTISRCHATLTRRTWATSLTARRRAVFRIKQQLCFFGHTHVPSPSCDTVVRAHLFQIQN